MCLPDSCSAFEKTLRQMPCQHKKIFANDRPVPKRCLALVALTLAFLPVSPGQTPEASAPPPKPYRERLLDRALKGDAEAQFDLGKSYEAGRIGLPKDLSQARHWYLEAANQGDPFAAASLGILYFFGKGVSRDYFEAYVWYERAVLHLTGSDRDSVAEMRDRAARMLNADEIAKGRKLAQEWKPVTRQQP
jgi:TPR repeat protein